MLMSFVCFLQFQRLQKYHEKITKSIEDIERDIQELESEKNRLDRINEEKKGKLEMKPESKPYQTDSEED